MKTVCWSLQAESSNNVSKRSPYTKVTQPTQTNKHKAESASTWNSSSKRCIQAIALHEPQLLNTDSLEGKLSPTQSITEAKKR